jgi:hypothetical protein
LAGKSRLRQALITICLALALFLLSSWAAWNLPLNNDISWQYWVARHLRGGATFYADVQEVNPPLWFWEAVPISALADRLHLATDHLVVMAMMARMVIALALLWMILRTDTGQKPALQVAGLSIALFGLTLFSFAEREHIMVLAALPYAALIARRRAGHPVDARLALVIGLVAAYGFALKPYFAIVPLALEAWLVLNVGRRWKPFRTETLAIAALAIVYGVGILIFALAYLSHMSPLVVAAYGSFGPPRAQLIVGQSYLLCWVAAAIAVALSGRRLSHQVQAAGVATLAFALCYLVQGKGFAYHALPVTIGSVWTLWLLLTGGGNLSRAARAAAYLSLFLAGATAALMGTFRPSTLGGLTAQLKQLPPGSSFAVISAHSWEAFPFAEQQRLVWPLRNVHLWTIPHIAREEARPGAAPSGSPVRRHTLDTLAADLWCLPPAAILVDDPGRSPALGGTGFSYRRFIESDRRIAELLSHYRVADTYGEAQLLVRRGPLAPRGRACRAVSIRPAFS